MRPKRRSPESLLFERTVWRKADGDADAVGHQERERSCGSIGRERLLMRTTRNIVGVMLIVFGSVWFLQGINVLPGSFMTGQIRWAVYGGIAVVVGVGLLVKANWRRRSRDQARP